MPKTLTLSEPVLGRTVIGVRTVKWLLLDEKGDGYLISWIGAALDTLRPECMAFPVEHFQGDARRIDSRKISWNEQAVSQNPDAALALREVMMQLKDEHGYAYEPETEPVYLLPGEVVADGYR